MRTVLYRVEKLESVHNAVEKWVYCYSMDEKREAMLELKNLRSRTVTPSNYRLVRIETVTKRKVVKV